MKQLGISVYLAFKEVWRGRGRFILFSLVIALITLLVLFIAALGEGLGLSNREYLSKVDGQLIVYSEKSDFNISASRLERSTAAAVRRTQGVADAGPLGTSAVKLQVHNLVDPLKVSLIGAEPGRPGVPAVEEGSSFTTSLSNEVIIDRMVARQGQIKVGDTVTVQATQGTKDQTYDLRVVGISSSQKFLFQPSIFVSYLSWDRIRPKSEGEVNSSDLVSNIIVVSLSDPAQAKAVMERLTTEISNIQVATIEQAISNVPGYTAQQSTVQTQGFFTLFIGLLVIGGFFQIQVLQKVPQIGVLKAIGASNPVVATAAILQIILVTAVGVAIGGLLTFLFSLSFPPDIPIVFSGSRSVIAVITMLLIGPVGGLVSVRYAVRIEPLKALGLSS